MGTSQLLDGTEEIQQRRNRVSPSTAHDEPRVVASETRRRRADSPIVAAVDGSTSGEAAAREAIAIAKRLGAPVVFVYVRDGRSSILGEPYYKRRLDAELARADRALDAALAAAERAGVVGSSGEVLEGAPARRLVEFADMRAARLVVVGPRRRRRFRRSVSRGVVRAADRPVMLAGATAPATT
jgi:nucleotide-binding universal stress UspA family protein